MSMKMNKSKLFTFLFFTLFLDAYRFFEIGNRDITPWYLGCFFLFLFSLINIQEVLQGIKKNPYTILIVFYMIINSVVMNTKSISSLQIGLLSWIFYISSYRKSSIEQFEKTVKFYQIVMNVLAVYGLYQVVAYMAELPFANLWFDGYMVDGYNWGNYITIGGISIRRANAIFREPSFFSQFLAINILIYVGQLLSDSSELRRKDGKSMIYSIIINSLAMILSFSGTGLLMVTIGVLWLLITNDFQRTKVFIKRYSIIVFGLLISISTMLVTPNPIRNYLLSRTSEFDSSNIYSVSGYLRMVLPYQAAAEMVKASPLFGIGIGNAFGYTLQNGYNLGASMQPILVRTIAEEGLIGLTILLLFVSKIVKNGYFSYDKYKSVFVGICLMSFMHGTWSSEVFWLLLGFINIKIVDNESTNSCN